MIRLVVFLCLAILLWHVQPARAWDPDEREYPVIELPDSAEAKWTPEPTPVEPPDGIYLVTDAYAGDSVVHNGPLTTYTTDTVHEITGSYARVLETVGTGDTSALDGASFNARASLTDGRPVAGTYYENFVLTDQGFVSVSVVFFQDDRELAQTPAPQAPPAAPPAPMPPTALPSVGPIEMPVERGDSPLFGYVTPLINDEDRVVRPDSPTAPPAMSVLPDRAIEVLRGRRISILFSGTDVRGWRALSTEGIALGPLSGAAGQPFAIRWDRLAPPNTSWIARFAIDYSDGTSRDLVIRVTVRAPGLIE